MTQQGEGPCDYEEQSFYEQETEWEFDAHELCRKPKEASKPRDFHLVLDVSAALGAVEGGVALAKIAIRALVKCLSPEERIELSSSGDHLERILRRMPVEEVDEVDFENQLDKLVSEGASHIVDNVLQRVAELDDLGDRDVTVVVLAASMDEDWASSGIMDELSHAMQRRRRLRFVFLGIHLPDESAAELTRLCQPYSNASFIQLKRPAAQIDGLFSSRLSAKHALEIDIRRPYQAAVIGRPVEFCVVMRNFSDQPIPAGSRLYMNPNGYFRSSFVELPEIRCGLVQGVVLRAVPKGRVTVFDLQERCELSIQTSDRQLIATQPFFLDMVDFIGDLGGKRHPVKGRSINLYVIGAQGAGKGSFINTMLTLLSDGDSVITAGADVGGGADHQTDRLAAFNVGKTMRSTRLPKFPFRIFDTWGMDKDNYMGAELEKMLQGRLPVGWHMKEDVDQLDKQQQAGSSSDRERIEATAHQREAHAVYFFISFSQVGDSGSVECLTRHFQTVKKLGFNPMVVLARVDEDEPAIRDDPLNWDLPKVAKLRVDLAKMLQVGLANVLVSVPYVTQDSLERSFAIEKLAYHNLRCGLDNALQYLMTSSSSDKSKGAAGGGHTYEDDDEDDDEDDLAMGPPPDFVGVGEGRDGAGGCAAGSAVEGEEADYGVRSASFMSDTASQSSATSSMTSTSTRRHMGGGWHDPYRMPPPPPPHHHHYYHHHGYGGYGHPRGMPGYRGAPGFPYYHMHGPQRGGRPRHFQSPPHYHQGYPQQQQCPPPPPSMDPHLRGDEGGQPPAPARQGGKTDEEEAVLVPPFAVAEAQQARGGSSLTNDQFRAQYFEPKQPEASS